MRTLYFALWFLSSIFFFIPRRISAAADWISTILLVVYHLPTADWMSTIHTWCGPSANLECRSEMCSTGFASWQRYCTAKLRRWTEGATCIRQGGHHVGHWPTFLVVVALALKYSTRSKYPSTVFWTFYARRCTKGLKQKIKHKPVWILVRNRHSAAMLL